MRSIFTLEDFHDAKSGDTPGPDFEWFAVDRENFVAGFTNAGCAPIPPTVFQSFALYDRTLDVIASLPIVGKVEWRGFKPPRFDTWEEWALRGLFTFDWDHGYGHPDDSLPYRWKCIPMTPIHISALPEDIGQYISKTRFENFLFSEVREILLNR